MVQGYGATETYAVSSLTMTVARVGPPSGSVAFRLVDVPEMNYFSGPEDEYRDKARAAFDSGKNKYGREGVDWRLIRNGWVLRSFCQWPQTWPPHQWYEKEDGRGFLQGRQLVVQDG